MDSSNLYLAKAQEFTFSSCPTTMKKMKKANRLTRLLRAIPAIVMASWPLQALAACSAPDTGTPGLKGICTNKCCDIPGLVNGIANWLTGLIGLVIVLVIVISGVQMIASAGNPEAIKMARGRITNAIIGLVTLIAMRLIVNIILPVTL